MDFFIGNIDEDNISVLNEASQKSKIKFRQGIYMESYLNTKNTYSFFPIFCESIEKGRILLKKYVELAEQDGSIADRKKDMLLLLPIASK